MEPSTYFTSEAVCTGHPDKVCDQIADALLDHTLAQDPSALADYDVAICPGHVLVMGKSSVRIKDIEGIVRAELTRIGYTRENSGVDPATCTIDVHLRKPSFDVSRTVMRSNRADAGSSDGGMCIGYACDETSTYMPAPIERARQMAKKLEALHHDHKEQIFPDGKAQVCYEYEDGVPKRVQSVILCVQHSPEMSTDLLRDKLEQDIVRSTIPASQMDDDTQIYINPTGFFMTGGPNVKAGCTGRKTGADFYGSATHHIGSSVAGKDPSKTTRSGAYMARYIAKNIVAAGIAHACEVRLTYAIGLTDPVCVAIDLDRPIHQKPKLLKSSKKSEGLVHQLKKWIDSNLDLRPEKIIEKFDLRRPIYHSLSCFGNVGLYAKQMSWEKTDIAQKIANDLGFQK